MPNKTGSKPRKPFKNILKATVANNVNNATTNTFQSYFPLIIVAEVAAEPAKLKPITIIIGPTTSGGNIVSNQPVPVTVIINATTK